MSIIDGKQIAQEIKKETKKQIERKTVPERPPSLAVIQVGNNPASNTYIKNKQKACTEAGIDFILHKYADISEERLINEIEKLNLSNVTGILVQLPLPKHINETHIANTIKPSKDVDGFHPQNLGKLMAGQHGIKPCTPHGIIELLFRSNIKIAGKHAVIIGRSNIVGKPMAALLTQLNATVTLCHSKTKNLQEIAKQADILIVAIGKPKFITKEFVKPGATVIDVGINQTDDGKLCGDVDFDTVKEIAEHITPVPGGVGPTTVAMLTRNIIDMYAGI